MRHLKRAVAAVATGFLIGTAGLAAATPAQAAVDRGTWECAVDVLMKWEIIDTVVWPYRDWLIDRNDIHRAVEVELISHECAVRVLSIWGELDAWEWGAVREGAVSHRGLREWAEFHA
ncbi:hypothetical protein [Catenuloplanes indicus]|uniref:Uncharacterized protein n=1 Tax=Catenuloplanes indicus TaxID=137267 RepID=A0AAE4AW54_9ACTN|nr:hypothetical protein [Catenuloplanes indicus]MDQ0364366.1 hypothetical protein [Catenuloplanes indicus]